jgi:asparagine synthase (glutamine-hydrolysing)
VGLGQLLLYNTPEALYERLPRCTAQGVVFTAEARIDNRDELCDLFAIPHVDRQRVPDSELILRAYLKWGHDSPEHLLGDWSFAFWRPAEKELFIARDHHGNTGLYYYQDARRFAFASSKKALLALGVPRRLNELFLAQLLVSWFAYHGDTTIDLDIKRLPPAHCMTVTPTGVKVQRYWRLEHTPTLHLPSFNDYLEGFLEVYRRAVRCRLRSYHPVGVALSGGLDSGSVAVMAAGELARQGARLMAFTAVPTHDVEKTVPPGYFGDEWPYARATTRRLGNVDLMKVRAEAISPVLGIQRGLALHDEPGHAASNAYWIAGLLAKAQQYGVGTMLTGQYGNATISWEGAPALNSISAALQQGWKAAAKRVLPAFLLRLYRRGQAGQVTWQDTAIHPDFAKRLALAHRHAAAVGNDITHSDTWCSPRDIRCALILPGRDFAGAFHAEEGAGYGLEMRDPTQDKRVLTYTLSIPDRYFFEPDGKDRRLIRRAMAGLLPDEVRLNTRRGFQGADIGLRLLNARGELEAALQLLADCDLSRRYLNLELMRASWENLQAVLDPHTTIQAITILLRGLMAGIFLVDLAGTSRVFDRGVRSAKVEVRSASYRPERLRF